MILSASKNYAQDNKNSLPREIGKISKISLKDIIDKKYLSKVFDYKKNNCDLDASYVEVQKTSNGKYSYYVTLICPKDNYPSKEQLKQTDDISITFTQNTDPKIPYIQLHIEGEKKLASYSYILYKDNKEIKNSGNIKINNKQSYDYKVDLKKYKEGIYKLKVTAINEDGESNTKASDMISIDFSNPSCENIKLTEGIKGWSNKDKTFSVDCVMTDGSACPTQTVTKKFTKDANSGYIKISDGKKTTYCQIDVKIDKTAPTCTVKSSSTGWTNKYVTLTGTCTDNLSGCQKSSISTKITNETNSNVSPGSVYDNAGNKTDCGKKLVQIDKTVPTCEIKYSDYITDKWTKYITLKPSNLFWTTHSRKINVKCNDKDGSECTLDNIEKIYNNNYFKNEYNDVIKTMPVNL